MSATEVSVEWRLRRAMEALKSGVSPVNFAMYAEIFGLDEEETIEIFHVAGCMLGVGFVVTPYPVLH